MARLMNIKAVKHSWVTDSYSSGEFMPIGKYELAFFEGLKIGVAGFKEADFFQIVRPGNKDFCS